MSVTFITGNKHKAELLERYLGLDILHTKLDLDEIQSFDLHKISEHKARQAYKKIKKPVLVEDVALEFKALGKLPGPYIKWFEQEIGLEDICRLLDSFASREAIAKVCFAYFDGKNLKFFDGQMAGKITPEPKGTGFGWNPIFISQGSDKTFAELYDEDKAHFSLRATTVFPQIKKFLSSLDIK